MANIWDDEERISDYDLIAEDAQQAEELAEEYASRPTIAEADEETLEEIAEESSFELSKSESNVIFNARLRLEQAKLYEMLINHNLFDGVDASIEAINNVQNELKFYIVKRLEILLGIREPVVKIATASSELPFNDIEIDFLKQLAYKGTLGASINSKANIPKVEQPKPLTPAPVGKLKSLASFKKPTPMAKKEEKPPASLPPAAAQSKTTAKAVPQKAKKQAEPPVKIRDSGLGRNLTEKEAELIAKEDLKNVSAKPFHEMNAKEKAAKIKEVNERHKRPTATAGVKPMPSANELEMKYMNQQSSRSHSKNQTDQFNLMLANALAVQKTRGEDNE